MTSRPPLSSLPDFIPLTINDAPLTADQLRIILGPQVDGAIQRLVERLAAKHIVAEEKAS